MNKLTKFNNYIRPSMSRPEEERTGNMGLAIVAVQCFADIFVVNQSLVLRINICGKNHHFAKPETVTGKL